MPKEVPQELKSESTIAAQPKDINKNTVQAIMMYDLCNWGTNDIAKELSLTAARVSIIKSSPLYKQEIQRRREELQKQIISKQSTKVTEGDPVKKIFQVAAAEAAEKKVTLMRDGKSEFVQNAAASEVLAHAGYKPENKKTVVSVMVTDKIADRFERVMGMDTDKIGSGLSSRTITVTRVEEVDNAS